MEVKLKHSSWGSIETRMIEAMKEQNMPLYRELMREHQLGPYLKPKVDSVMLQLKQLIEAGYQEHEAYEVVRDQIHLMP